jgi:hypothetical protein
MTTRIHVVNFGPQPVEVLVTPDDTVVHSVIYPQQAEGYYVYEGQIVRVREQKPEPVVSQNQVPGTNA